LTLNARVQTLVPLHYDSQVAIVRAQSKNYNERKRHLTVRHEPIRHAFSCSAISVYFVKSENIIVDPRTKGLMHQKDVES